MASSSCVRAILRGKPRAFTVLTTSMPIPWKEAIVYSSVSIATKETFKCHSRIKDNIFNIKFHYIYGSQLFCHLSIFFEFHKNLHSNPSYGINSYENFSAFTLTSLQYKCYSGINPIKTFPPFLALSFTSLKWRM